MLTARPHSGTMHEMSAQKQTVRLSIIKALCGSTVHAAHVCVVVMDDEGRERLTVGLDLDAKAFSDFALQGVIRCKTFVRVRDPQEHPVLIKLAKAKYSNPDRRAHLTLEILDAEGRPRLTVSADLDADRYSKLMLWEAVHVVADVVEQPLLESCPGDGAFYSVGCVDGRLGGASCLRCNGTSIARTGRAKQPAYGVPFASEHGGLG